MQFAGKQCLYKGRLFPDSCRLCPGCFVCPVASAEPGFYPVEYLISRYSSRLRGEPWFINKPDGFLVPVSVRGLGFLCNSGTRWDVFFVGKRIGQH